MHNRWLPACIPMHVFELIHAAGRAALKTGIAYTEPAPRIAE